MSLYDRCNAVFHAIAISIPPSTDLLLTHPIKRRYSPLFSSRRARIAAFDVVKHLQLGMAAAIRFFFFLLFIPLCQSIQFSR